MTTYAQVVDGRVQRVWTSEPEFAEIPLDQQMAPEIAAQMVALSAAQAKTVSGGWSYNGAVFTAPAEPPAEPFRIIWKADVWRRCSADEAETLDGVLAQAPVRLRRIFEAAQYLDPADPDFPVIRDAVVLALGEARAAEVLAPS